MKKSIVLISLLCLIFFACEKPQEVAKRIAEEPKIQLIDLKITKDLNTFTFLTEQGNWKCDMEQVIITFDSSITTPMVKNYAYGGGSVTELFLKNIKHYEEIKEKSLSD